jgi:protein-tyrosine phosphatase
MEMTAGQRIPFDGVANFRDIGGYPSQLGGVVRTGRVYRADRLDRMSEDDRARFEQLGIRTIFDLRRVEEVARAPDPYPSINVCIISTIEAAGHPPFTRDGKLVDERPGEIILRDLYRGILLHAGADIGRILTDLADPELVPAVFHCTAGKDRTGIVAALLLEWLGVPRALILDDYELTNVYRQGAVHSDNFDQLVKLGLSPEAAAGLLSAPRWAMEEALNELDADFGGIETYLRDRAGLDDDVLRALRDTLLA